MYKGLTDCPYVLADFAVTSAGAVMHIGVAQPPFCIYTEEIPVPELGAVYDEVKLAERADSLRKYGLEMSRKLDEAFLEMYKPLLGDRPYIPRPLTLRQRYRNWFKAVVRTRVSRAARFLLERFCDDLHDECNW